MKTAIKKIMDIIEMEHNNGVEISQKVLWKMLLDAKEKEKQQIIEAHAVGVYDCISGEQYYNETFKN